MRRLPFAVVGAVLLTVAGCSGRPAAPASTADSPSASAVAATTTSGPTDSLGAGPSAQAPSPPVSSAVSLATTSPSVVRSSRATSPSAAKALIPAEFRGSWNTDPKACGTESEGMMVVDAHVLRLYEGSGPVTSVVRKGDVITITATWNAEGTVQTEVFDLKISSDGEQVTNLTTDTLRYRCH
jgi:hypothetical protein